MGKAKEIIKRLEIISESSLSRVWQHVEKDTQFGVLSASRSENTKVENDLNHLNLKKQVRELGYGYIEMKGGFVETLDDGNKLEVEENSLFIPKISKNEIMKLGTDYDQDTILFRDSDGFYEIGTSKRMGIGKIISKFKSSNGRENLDFTIELLKRLFSSLKKGSHKDKKFLFKKVSEKIHTGMSQVWKQELDNRWITIWEGN